MAMTSGMSSGSKLFYCYYPAEYNIPKSKCPNITMPKGEELQEKYEIRPDTQKATHNNEDPFQNAKTGVDYEPHPEKSIRVSPEHKEIVRHITNLNTSVRRNHSINPSAVS